VVGYFRDLTKGDRIMKVITKLVDSGGARPARVRSGKIRTSDRRSFESPEGLKGPVKKAEKVNASNQRSECKPKRLNSSGINA